MLTLTDPRLETALSRVASRRGLAGLPPVLIEGVMGSGKRHYLRHLLRRLCCSQGYDPFAPGAQSCTCLTCTRLEEGCSDVTELAGTEPIAVLRGTVAEVVARRPTQLPCRVLLLRRVERYSDAALDTLLRLAEDPPEHLRLLATARSSRALPETLQGRFRVLRHAAMTLEQVRAIASQTAALRAAMPQFGDYPFTSVGQLQTAVSLDFERRFQELFLSPDFAGLERRTQALLKDAEALPERSLPDIIELFVEWLYWRVSAYCREQATKRPGYVRVLDLLPSVTRMHQSTLSRYLHEPNPRAWVTPTAQLYSYISALGLLRRAAAP